jgi:hypothetical protein
MCDDSVDVKVLKVVSLHSFAHARPSPKGHPCFRSLGRLLFETKEALVSWGLKSCTVLYDGQVIWSELDEETLRHMYEFIRVRPCTLLNPCA